MKGELTGLFLWSSPHAMIRALILEVLFREGGEREGERGGGWRRDRGEVKARQPQEVIEKVDRMGWEKWVGW